MIRTARAQQRHHAIYNIYYACILILLSLASVHGFMAPFPANFAQAKIPTRQPNLLSRSVVADSETEEQQHKRHRDSDNDDSWIPTNNGGFLPNFNKILTRGSTDRTIQQVTSLAEYKRVVVDESRDCLVCVRFYAPWCRACKAIAPPFRRLAATYQTVKFVEVPLTQETARLHQGLNIPSLPFAHIYHPAAGLVEERKINRKEFPEFARVLKTYVEGYCSYPRQEKVEEPPSDLSP